MNNYITPNPIRKQMPTFFFNFIRTFHNSNIGKPAKAKSETTEMTATKTINMLSCWKSAVIRNILLA